MMNLDSDRGKKAAKERFFRYGEILSGHTSHMHNGRYSET